MGYILKKWYRLDVDKIKKKYGSLYKFEREMNLPRNYSYKLKEQKISSDNKYFSTLESYLVEDDPRDKALGNKLNIRSSNELKEVEEKITKKNIINLWKENKLNDFECGTFSSLRYIHFETFKDVYDFAGKIRNVDIAKDNFQFAPIRYIDTAIKQMEAMPIETYDEIIDKYAELNVIHPFREGNGRAMRVWLNNILENKLDIVVDWSAVDKEKYLNAMVLSPVDTKPLKQLLRKALTDKVDDEVIFFKGLDNSYNYEEMTRYRSEDIDD